MPHGTELMLPWPARGGASCRGGAARVLGCGDWLSCGVADGRVAASKVADGGGVADGRVAASRVWSSVSWGSSRMAEAWERSRRVGRSRSSHPSLQSGKQGDMII